MTFIFRALRTAPQASFCTLDRRFIGVGGLSWFRQPVLGIDASIEPNSYGNVAGWVAGSLSQPVLYQND